MLACPPQSPLSQNLKPFCTLLYSTAVGCVFDNLSVHGMFRLKTYKYFMAFMCTSIYFENSKSRVSKSFYRGRIYAPNMSLEIKKYIH